MASSSKKKTTMAKLARENRLRERRLQKQAKKDARKQAPAQQSEWPAEPLSAATADPAQPDGPQPPLGPVPRQLADS